MININGMHFRPQRPCKNINHEVKIGPPPWDKVEEPKKEVDETTTTEEPKKE